MAIGVATLLLWVGFLLAVLLPPGMALALALFLGRRRRMRRHEREALRPAGPGAIAGILMAAAAQLVVGLTVLYYVLSPSLLSVLMACVLYAPVPVASARAALRVHVEVRRVGLVLWCLSGPQLAYWVLGWVSVILVMGLAYLGGWRG